MTEDSHRSLFGLIVAVAVGVVLGGLALTMALWVLGGLLCESLVLLGVTLVFSMITRPILVVCLSIEFF